MEQAVTDHETLRDRVARLDSKINDLDTDLEQAAMDLAACYVERMLRSGDETPGEEETRIARHLFVVAVRFGLTVGERSVYDDLDRNFFIKDEVDGYYQ